MNVDLNSRLQIAMYVLKDISDIQIVGHVNVISMERWDITVKPRTENVLARLISLETFVKNVRQDSSITPNANLVIVTK